MWPFVMWKCHRLLLQSSPLLFEWILDASTCYSLWAMLCLCLSPTDGTGFAFLNHRKPYSSNTRETLTALAFLWACLSHHITWAGPEKCWLFIVVLFKHGWTWPNRQGPFIYFIHFLYNCFFSPCMLRFKWELNEEICMFVSDWKIVM